MIGYVWMSKTKLLWEHWDIEVIDHIYGGFRYEPCLYTLIII